MFYAQQQNRCICIHRGKTLDLDKTLAYLSVVFGKPDHGEIRFNDINDLTKPKDPLHLLSEPFSKDLKILCT